MRAALYARVSTEDQAKEGYSIPAQLKRLNSYCKARGWSVVAEYVDEGFSGRDIKRPAYQLMMHEHAKWDVLVVLKMDRIHRNSRNFAEMMDNLNEWKKEFNSMQENFDTTTAIGRFVMDIVQRIAQLESEQIGERVKMGMMQKAKKGCGYLGFAEPYGYEFHERRLVLKENEASIVKEIFNSYLAGASLEQIANRLNARLITTKKNKVWKKSTIANILKNPLYCGYIEWNGILRKAQHQSIISLEEFNKTQLELLLRRRKASPELEKQKVESCGVAHG